MKGVKGIFTFIYLLFFFVFANGQSIDFDSLKSAFRKNPNEKNFKKLHDVVFYLNKTNSDSALILADFYLEIAESTTNERIISNANYSLGSVYYAKGNFKKALFHMKKNLAISIKLKDTPKKIETYNALGLVYASMGKIQESSDAYFKGLKLCKQGKVDLVMLSTLYQNIGSLYSSAGDYKKSITYMKLALECDEKNGEMEDLVYSYLNLGGMYANIENYDSAEYYTMKSVEGSEKIGDLTVGSTAINNMALISYFKGNNEKAQEYFNKAIEMKKSIGHNIGYLETLQAIGIFYLGMKDYTNAEYYCRKAYAESQKLNYPLKDQVICNCISESAAVKGNFKDAYEFYRLSVSIRDTLINLEHKSELAEEEQKLKYEIKAASDSIKREEEKKVEEARLAESNAKLKQEQTQRYALIGGLILVFVFSLFIFNRLRVIRKQRDLIFIKELEAQEQRKIVEHQKEIVEEKHKEITDSINYAERIQKSFLATKNMLNDNLNEFFILFQPKDVVSGDFYWADKLSNGNFLIAAADSTGHGVPGAIMSILNITSLENAVKEGAVNPSDILNHTRKNIIDRLKKDGSAEGGKDGMDCSLLSFDFKNNKLSFALANNPLWIIRKNELIEFAADKMPVGKHDRDSVPFAQHEIDLQKGDLIYIFTDGYADQFGGEKGKKFKYSNLKKLILENANAKLQTQNSKLKDAFSEWKGDLEQVDDVCIIGIRI